MVLGFVLVGRRRASAFLALAAIAVTGIVSLSCGGGPAANPLPTATPTTPPATPTTPPVAVCPFGDGSLNAQCEQHNPSQLMPQVQAAIDVVIGQHPEFFDETKANPD